MTESQRHPFLHGLSKHRGAPPTVAVIVGASGDLTARKLIPAVYNLAHDNLLPADFHLVGFGRKVIPDQEFRDLAAAAVREFSRREPDPAVWERVAARTTYVAGGYDEPAAFERLAAHLDGIERRLGRDVQGLFYISTPPSVFAPILTNLGASGLAARHAHGPLHSKVVIEKPFGRDLESAMRLNRDVGKVFRESQVYRIDHYLGKETVRNILIFRFGNLIFEPIWHRRYIDHVQITVAESIGVEGRGAFYEETGALRDILQNHLLQLLTLVAMEPPASLEADALRDEKVKVLRAVRKIEASDVGESVVRGQYGPGWIGADEVHGYRQEPAVDPASETETFVAARFEVDDWRWAGVPFYLRAGKRLPKRATEIAIQFKDVPQRLFAPVGADPEANMLVIRIQPDEGILLRFAAKAPGLGIDVRPVNMDFAYGSAFSVDSPDAYETLILDALLGDASLFTRADEVEAAWKIVDPIIEAWVDGPEPALPNYAAGTWGPDAADELLTREGRRWRRL